MQQQAAAGDEENAEGEKQSNPGSSREGVGVDRLGWGRRDDGDPDGPVTAKEGYARIILADGVGVARGLSVSRG